MEEMSLNLDDDDNSNSPDEGVYGGIGRLSYFLLTIFFGFFLVAVSSPSYGREDSSLSFFFILGVLLVIASQRLKNVGASPWLALLILIPIVGLWINLKCLAAPEGYEDTGVIDLTGKIICVLVLVPFVLLFVTVILSVLFK